MEMLYIGSVEFVATREFLVRVISSFILHFSQQLYYLYNILLYFSQVREPMPAVFFFLIDVSMNALQTGATAGACSAISQVIADLPVSSC